MNLLLKTLISPAWGIASAINSLTHRHDAPAAPAGGAAPAPVRDTRVAAQGDDDSQLSAARAGIQQQGALIKRELQQTRQRLATATPEQAMLLEAQAQQLETLARQNATAATTLQRVDTFLQNGGQAGPEVDQLVQG